MEIRKTLSLDEAKNYIDQIDFSMIVDKVVSTTGWKRRHVEKLRDYYKNFLFLKKKYPDTDVKIPPTDEIDELWHAHILDTHKYFEDCNAIFGEYLHHYPYLGRDGKSNLADVENSFKNMQELHKKEFGDYIYRVRPIGLFGAMRITGDVIKQWIRDILGHSRKNTDNL